MSAQHSFDNPISIPDFTASKQVSFFGTLKKPRFSGELVLKSTKGEEWYFYLYLGRITYATGGIHPVRRWQRNLKLHFPHLVAQVAKVDLNKMQEDGLELSSCWEYQLLTFWVAKRKIQREKAVQFIRNTIIEVLFDITQAMEVTCELRGNVDLFSKRLVLIDAEQAIAQAQELWQRWQGARIADRSPNSAPVIRQAAQLQRRTSPQVYQTLTHLLDGQHTLRDLAVRTKRDVLKVTTSLLPYLQMGLIELVMIDDLPAPVTLPRYVEETEPEEEDIRDDSTPLIACVDDSPLMCQTMEVIVTAANYQYVGISDSLRAIAILLARKPDLIFLDLIMPNASGYEICGQLRKLSVFQKTPIVILTGNDSIIERMRAKMVGSSDFLSKPVSPETVIQVIQKHLK